MTIGSSQIKSLLGLKGSTNTFIEAWSGVFKQIGETKLWDPLLGAFSILILVLMKVKLSGFLNWCSIWIHLDFINEWNKFQKMTYKKNLSELSSDESVWRNECKKYLVLGRNAIVVIFGTVLAYILHNNGHDPFALTGKCSVPILAAVPSAPEWQNNSGSIAIFIFFRFTRLVEISASIEKICRDSKTET